MLDDVRVLDVTQVVAGGFAGLTLADLGAEVIKIERPDGEIGRSTPPFVGDASAWYAALNRGKRSVPIDLAADRGREAFLDLVETADVVLENHPAGRMAEFGLGPEAVRERNPAVVYCSITGFGQDGPYAEYPALDLVVQAMSGNMSITGPPEGDPYRSGFPVGDLAGSMYAVQSILAALLVRESTGRGQAIDVSMLEGLLAWSSVRAAYTFATGEPYPRTGNQLEGFVPYNTFPTADGELVVICVSDGQWQRLCKVIERPALAEDDRYARNEDRREHREAVNALLADAFSEQPATDWFEALSGAGVPSAPVYDTREVWDDPHVRARGIRVETELDGTSFHAIDHPARFSDAETGHDGGSPTLGSATRAVFDELGYDPAAVDNLVESGVLAAVNR